MAFHFSRCLKNFCFFSSRDAFRKARIVAGKSLHFVSWVRSLIMVKPTAKEFKLHIHFIFSFFVYWFCLVIRKGRERQLGNDVILIWSHILTKCSWMVLLRSNYLPPSLLEDIIHFWETSWNLSCSSVFVFVFFPIGFCLLFCFLVSFFYFAMWLDCCHWS